MYLTAQFQGLIGYGNPCENNILFWLSDLFVPAIKINASQCGRASTCPGVFGEKFSHSRALNCDEALTPRSGD